MPAPDADIQNRAVWGLPPVLWLALISMALIRFGLMLGTGPIHDEAYYWAWSQRLDYGYYDQPFLVGWLLWPFVSVLGDQAWVLRLVSGGLTLLTSVFLARLTLDLAAQTDEHGQVDAARVRATGTGLGVLLLTSPGLWGLGLFYVHDAVMMTFLSLGLLLGSRALQRGSVLLWLATGAALALAFSAKVSAALWIAAFGLTFLLVPSGRAQLGRAGPWLAALIIMAAAALFVLWNANHGWVTFRHVGAEHLSPEADGPGERLGRAVLVLLALIILTGPAAALLWLWPARQDAGRPAGLTKLTKLAILGLLLFIALPVLFILGLSLTREVLLNWLLPSALVLSALAALRWPSSRPGPAALGSLGLSLVASVVLCLIILIPLMLREPRWMLSNARDIYGWEAALGDLVAYRDAEFPDHRIAGNYYLLASQLAFYQNEVSASVGDDPRPHQFQLFAETPAGGNSRTRGPLLVLTTDQASGQAALEGWYCELQPLRPWPIVHRGWVIDTPFLFRVDQHRSDADPGCAPTADAPETDPTGSD
ncbi:MAG: glycosyltransferase family 39 protein [Pseudomonadota bacterium]|nr:glycosyltransferase family 39 protein [Pseudomonadota bacterium]